MIKIEEYILLTKEDRQKHLRLEDPCIERGGPEKGGLSAYCKGLMAHILDTSIPSGMMIQICHACNNARCSNPSHLYWGTASENAFDRMNNGDKTVWEKVVEKYGLEEARNMQKRNGNMHGSGNKNKPKTEEHKQKISDSLKQAK